MWMMIGLLGGNAQAGDVWLVLDDARRHVEVPAEWFVSDGGSAHVTTRAGAVDLVKESEVLQRGGVGAQRAWPLADGQLRLEHRDVVPASAPGSTALAVQAGAWTLALDLGSDGATAALGPVDAAVQADGLTLQLSGEDLFAPLRRSPPTTLFRGTDKKQRPVLVELR